MSKLAVLEALIVAIVMLDAVAYVVHLQPQPDPHNNIERMLEQKAYDFLWTAKEAVMPNEPCAKSQLERLVFEGLRQNTTYWKQRSNQFFGPGVETALWMHNGETYLPLQATHDFRAVSESVHFTPDYTFAMPIPGVGVASGQESLQLGFPAIRDGTLMTPAGEAVLARVATENTVIDTAYTRWGLTALLGNRTQNAQRTVAESVAWGAGGGFERVREINSEQLLGTQNVPKWGLIIKGHASDSAVHSSISSTRIVPSGTTVEITIPPGWAWEHDLASESLWQLSNSAGDEARGWRIIYTLRSDTEDVAELTFDAALSWNPIRPFDVFHARLGNGSVAEASLVVTYPVVAEKDLPRSVHLTMPYPVRNDTWALMGVSFVNGGEDTLVKQVDIEVPGGYDFAHHSGSGAHLFANATPRDPGTINNASGWSWVNGRHLQWKSDNTQEDEVKAGEVKTWFIDVLYNGSEWETGVIGQHSSGPQANLTFDNGYSMEGNTWGQSPGIITLRVPNATLTPGGDGYPWTPEGVANAAVHTYTARVQDDHEGPSATGGYTLVPSAGDLVSLQNSLANSTFQVSNRSVPIGGVVRADADLQSLVTQLSKTGITETNLTIDVYDPSSRGCSPTITWSRNSSTMPLARATSIQTCQPLANEPPNLFMVAEDGYAYRLSTLGAPLWSTDLDTVGTVLRCGELQGGYGIVIGTGDGRILRLDPLTGVVQDWAALTSPITGASNRVTSLELNQTSGEVAAGTELGSFALVDLQADSVQQEDDAGATRVLQVAFAPEGGAYSLRADRLQHHDASATTLATYETDNLLATTLGQTHVLLASQNTTFLLDPITLAKAGEVPVRGSASLAAAGDATADGVPDLALALEDFGIQVIDGATGVLVLDYVAPVNIHIDPTGEANGEDPIGWSMTDTEGNPIGPREDAYGCTLYGGTWHSAVPTTVCDPGQRTTQNQPLHIHVSHGRISLTLITRGQMALQHFDVPNFDPLLDQPWTKTLTELPSVLAHGAWQDGLGTSNAILLGLADGRVQVIDQDTQAELLNADPSQFVGQFTLYIPTPAGGFFGTHLLVAGLSWTDQNGVVQTARLADWFHLVGSDGKPVQNPLYEILLVARDRADE